MSDKTKRRRQRALIHRGNQWFDGWTGFEYFGCLSPHRYFGWRLHCWADVYVKAFGDIRQAIFFARVADALPVLDRLMTFADRHGHLAHEPVKYWEGPAGWKPDWRIGFEFISPQMIGDRRVPDSPAHERRLRQRFGRYERKVTASQKRKQKRFLEWRLSAPPPELYL